MKYFMFRFKKRSLQTLFVCLLVGFGLRWLFLTLSPFLLVQIYHFRWHWHSTLYRFGAVGLLSKQPLVQLVSDKAVDIVFEVRHDVIKAFMRDLDPQYQVSLIWTIESDTVHHSTPAVMTHDEMETLVYRTRLERQGITAEALQYQVQVGTWLSKRYYNKLLSSAPGKMHTDVAVLGDNQFAAVKFSQVLHHLTKTTKEIDCLIHVGDAVQDAASARAWSTDFWDPLNRNNLLDRPLIMLRGNHDAPSVYTSSPGKLPASTTTEGYTRLTIPIPGDGNSGYIFLLILDANDDSELQERFLRAQLSSESARSAQARIVLTHIPPFVEFWDPVPWRAGESKWGEHVRLKYVALFESFDVDLVLSGHQHNYQRGRKAGVTYVIAGGAGGTLDHDRVEDWNLADRVTIVEHHYAVLRIEATGGRRWRMYLLDGTIGDEFNF